MITLDYLTHAAGHITADEVKAYGPKLEQIKQNFNKKKEMLDWFNLGTTITQKQIDEIKQLTKKIHSTHSILIVVGVGGSYLGAEAIQKSLTNYFADFNKNKVIFAGYNLSGEYLRSLIKYLENKNFYINYISKSGTTLEPNLAFETLLAYAKQRYPKKYQERVVITTNEKKSPLVDVAKKEGYHLFTMPENIGGRYSLLTPVGMFPLCVCDVDIDAMLKGAEEQSKNIDLALEYAVARDILYHKGYKVDAFTIYEPKLSDLASWWQQLFGETQGKNKKGIFPICNVNTANLHSIGQYLQDGEDIIFETVLRIKKLDDFELPNSKISYADLNMIVLDQVAVAHAMGNTPSIIINIDEINAFNFGELVYFFFVAAAAGAYLLNENPFNQPGVEKYKQLVKEKIKELI